MSKIVELEDWDGNPVKVVDGIAYTKELLDDIRKEQRIHDSAGLNLEVLRDSVNSGIELIKETHKFFRTAAGPLVPAELPVPEVLEFVPKKSHGLNCAEIAVRFDCHDPDMIEHQCEALFSPYRKYLKMIERDVDIVVCQPVPSKPWSAGIYKFLVSAK